MAHYTIRAGNVTFTGEVPDVLYYNKRYETQLNRGLGKLFNQAADRVTKSAQGSYPSGSFNRGFQSFNDSQPPQFYSGTVQTAPFFKFAEFPVKAHTPPYSGDSRFVYWVENVATGIPPGWSKKAAAYWIATRILRFKNLPGKQRIKPVLLAEARRLGPLIESTVRAITEGRKP